MAKAYFGIPVTSALVERFFSKTGYFLRPHRLCMQDDLAENLFYAKENINFLIDNKIFFSDSDSESESNFVEISHV